MILFASDAALHYDSPSGSGDALIGAATSEPSAAPTATQSTVPGSDAPAPAVPSYAVKDAIDAAVRLARSFPESVSCAYCGELRSSDFHLTIADCWAKNPICRDPEGHHDFIPSVVV